MKQIITIISFIAFALSSAAAQNDTIKSFNFQGYAELYYSYDFSNPQNHEKPNFIYSHKRHNEINVNLAFAKASYNKNGMRLQEQFRNLSSYFIFGKKKLKKPNHKLACQFDKFEN